MTSSAVALPTNNPVSMSRKVRPENKEQKYYYRERAQNLHEIYRYAYVSDREEGLVVIDIDCLTDGDPQNNFVKRVATYNPGKVLTGAENLILIADEVIKETEQLNSGNRISTEDLVSIETILGKCQTMILSGEKPPHHSRFSRTTTRRQRLREM